MKSGNRPALSLNNEKSSVNQDWKFCGDRFAVKVLTRLVQRFDFHKL